MRKAIYLIAFLVAYNSMNAQVFKVGDINCNYTPVNYNFNPSCPQYTTGTDYYYIDIDQDATNDFSISSRCWWYYSQVHGGYINPKELYIVPTNTNCQMVMGSGGSILNLGFGTPLDNSLSWAYSGGFPTGTSSTTYYGLRKILSGDTIYCWLNMINIFPGTVIAFAFKRTSDTFIPSPATINSLPASICKGDSISLNGNPSGGNFYGNGVSNNYFKSKNLAAGVYTVMYTVPSATCMTSPSVSSITVNALPTITFTGMPYYKCVGDTLTVGALPAGGTFSYSAAGFSVNTIYCSQSGLGTHTLTYTYTDGNGCTKSQPSYVVVASCVGINELSQEPSNFQIFPNPNNGEFKIMTTKEVVIDVINELGQLIKTVELNSENDYTSRITELKSGVYFIGNNYIRQKIVVIK